MPLDDPKYKNIGDSIAPLDGPDYKNISDTVLPLGDPEYRNTGTNLDIYGGLEPTFKPHDFIGVR